MDLDFRRTLRHEIGNTITVLTGYEYGLKDRPEPDVFADILAAIDPDAPEPCPHELRAHATAIRNEKPFYDPENWVRATELQGTLQGVAGLTEAYLQDDRPDITRLYRVLNGAVYAPLNVSPDAAVEGVVNGNDAWWLLFHTAGKNAQEHAIQGDGTAANLYLAVREQESWFDVYLWDDGTGLSEDIDIGQFWERDYGTRSGFGTYLMNEVAGLMGGTVTMYEERRDWMHHDREVGLGYRIEMPKP